MREDVQELNDFYPVIAEAVDRAVRPLRVPSQSSWLRKVLDYNVDRVRWPSAVITLNAMRVLSGRPREAIPPETTRKAKVLAWCIELMNASCSMVDDVIDNSEMRWDKPCWHKTPGVELHSICDAILLKILVYHLLRQEFKGCSYYEDLIELYSKTLLAAYLGQNDDCHVASANMAMSDSFTLERYKMAVRVKTAMAGFYIPAAAAMHASSVKLPAAYEVALDLAVDLAVILQINDDYSDCFGEGQIDNKSADIRNGTCTWMILRAKQEANLRQKQILQDNYGFDDDSKVDAVKEVFKELRLKASLLDYRETLYRTINEKIELNAEILHPNIYKYALEVLQESTVESSERNKVEYSSD